MRAGARLRAAPATALVAALTLAASAPASAQAERSGAGGSPTTGHAGERALTHPATPVPASVSALRTRITEILGQGRYGNAAWGALVISLERGDTLFARNVHDPLTPASNLKLVTSAAALHHLGPDFRYTTWVVGDGELRDTVFHGDLVLYGTGDPGIAPRFHETRELPYRELARQLREGGIRRVTGRILGDGTFFQGPLLADGWPTRDLNEWYTAPSGALSYNENIVAVRIRPGEVDLPPVIETIPDHVGLLFANEARTVAGRSRRPVWMLRDHPSEPIRLVGEMSMGARDIWRQMTVKDPSLLAAHAFTHVLREEGVVVDAFPGVVTSPSDSPVTARLLTSGGNPPRVLATFRSPPVSDYLRAVNQRSHNLYADLLFKTLGRLVDGNGSFPGGAAVVRRFLTRTAGVPGDEFSVVDGSGLSVHNRISAGGLMRVLLHLRRGPHWEVLRASLPVAGSRQMFRRMARTAAAGNLRAKTGTMDRVSSLTGVVTTADGEELAFVLLGNELPSEMGAKRLEDQVGRTLAGWRR